MAKSSSDGMRIGPISLLTLIAVLLLAVLAMLCVTTANATSAMANRQAGSITQTYKLDSCGQTLLANIDGVLAQAEETGASGVQAVEDNRGQIIDNTLTNCGNDDISISLEADSDTVSFTISLSDARALEASIRIDANAGYSIESWKTSTLQELPQETLWAGSSTGK